MQSSPLNTYIPRSVAQQSSPRDTARSERLINCRCFPDPISWYTASLLDRVGMVKYNQEDICVRGFNYCILVSMPGLRRNGSTAPFSCKSPLVLL